MLYLTLSTYTVSSVHYCTCCGNTYSAPVCSLMTAHSLSWIPLSYATCTHQCSPHEHLLIGPDDSMTKGHCNIFRTYQWCSTFSFTHKVFPGGTRHRRTGDQKILSICIFYLDPNGSPVCKQHLCVDGSRV